MGTHLVPRDTNAAALAVATPAEETLREGGMVIVPEFWWACVLSTAWWMRTVSLGKSAASQDVAASASPDSSCSACPQTPTSPMGLHLNQSSKHPSCSDLSGIFWKPRRDDVLGLVTLPQISGLLLFASATWSTQNSPGDRSFSFSIKDWHGPSRLYCVGPQMRWGSERVYLCMALAL